MAARLADDDATVRADAATALGATGDHRATRQLIRALDDEDQFVQVAAARALGVLGDPSAELPLRDMANDRARDPWLQQTALRALEQLGLEPSQSGRPAILVWVVGIAVIAASLALVPTIGGLAIVGLIAGAAIIVGYYAREARGRDGGGDGGGHSGDGGYVSDDRGGGGWFGDLFGGGNGGGGGGNGGG